MNRRARGPGSTPPGRPKVGARLRLTLSYAIFLLIAGAGVLLGIYVVLRYVPVYPLADPYLGNVTVSPSPIAVPSRGQILGVVVTTSGYILLLLAVIGLAGGWLIAGWILRPLQLINRAAEVAATGDLHHRIGLSGRNDEFRQLADNFDHMLDRLGDAFGTQQRFAANASHELRTPLAIMSTLLDVARRNPEHQDYPVLLERLRITNDRAVGLTESLLRLADANAITAVSQPVDLAVILRGVVEENRPEADERGVTLVMRLDAAPVTGDAALLAQAAANLVQNAIRHNETPGSATISTRHDAERGIVTLRVESGGSHFTREAAARLTEPFLRGAGRVHTAGQPRSYGLGLTLVTRITEVHNGSFSLVPRPRGGLDVAITLPIGGSTP